MCFLQFKNHPLWWCLKISNPQHKRRILTRNGLCFICFHKGHLASSCTLSNYYCDNCKGNRNISICIESKKPVDRSNTGSSSQSNTASIDENNTNPTDRMTKIILPVTQPIMFCYRQLKQLPEIQTIYL